MLILVIGCSTLSTTYCYSINYPKNMTPEQISRELKRIKRRLCCTKTLSLTSSQRDSLVSPSNGLFIYNLTTGKYNFFNGTLWEEVTSSIIPTTTTSTTTTASPTTTTTTTV